MTQIKNKNRAGLESREVALKTLIEWGQNKGFIKDILNKQAAFYPQLTQQDRAFVQQLVYGVLRQLNLLDLNIKRWTQAKTDKKVLWILRLSLYQLWWLETPAYSVLDISVELTKKLASHKTAGFVNALLRKASTLSLQIPDSSNTRDLSDRYSHPTWMIHNWIQEWGTQTACLRLKANNMEPEHWLRVDLSQISIEEAQAQLGIEESETRFDHFIAISQLRDLFTHPLFVEGKISIQDPSSYLVCQIVDPKSNELILDMCAAPGGKTAVLKELCPQSHIISADLSAKRLHKIFDIEKRLKVNTLPVATDGLTPAFKKSSFDKILLDAPCSNLGVIRRKPEVRWNVSKDSVKEIAKLQAELLDSASQLLKVGGAIVYSTCSPERPETIDIIEKFLETHTHFELQSVRPFVNRRYAEGDMLRIVPQPGSLDGFFAARLVRKE